MKVGDICNRDVVVVKRNNTILTAAKLMKNHHVGSLVVIDEAMGGKKIPVGIVTDRDIVVKVMAMGLNPELFLIDDIITPFVITANQYEDSHQAIQKMHKSGVRRMPIVDTDENLVGILSIDDLLEAIAEELIDLSFIFEREQQKEKNLGI